MTDRNSVQQMAQQRRVQSAVTSAPATPIDPNTGLPSYYSTIGAPLFLQEFGEGEQLQLAEEAGQDRQQMLNKAEMEAEKAAAAERNAAATRQLEREAGVAPAAANSTTKGMSGGSGKLLGKLTGALTTGALLLGEARIHRISNTLMIVGVFGIIIGALGIWLGVAGIKQAKALRSADRDGFANKSGKGWALGVSIASTVLGAIGVAAGLFFMVTGQSLSLLGSLVSLALLIVGSVAIHKLSKSDDAVDGEPDKSRGVWAHVAGGLWIAAMVVFLVLPGVAALAIGAVMKSRLNRL